MLYVWSWGTLVRGWLISLQQIPSVADDDNAATTMNNVSTPAAASSTKVNGSSDGDMKAKEPRQLPKQQRAENRKGVNANATTGHATKSKPQRKVFDTKIAVNSKADHYHTKAKESTKKISDVAKEVLEPTSSILSHKKQRLNRRKARKGDTKQT